VERAIALLAPHSALLSKRCVGIAINLSGQSLDDPTFGDFLAEKLEHCGLEPSLFSFEPHAIVVLRGAEQNRAELEPILVRAFGLTPAEAQVAARLALGELRETIADERGASLQTVRSQIKSIFAKLNVTRERELVSLLAKITQR